MANLILLFSKMEHKVNLNRGGLCIDSPDRIKRQKSNSKLKK